MEKVMPLSDLEFISRLFLAVSLGALIGLERQWHQRFAGLRTNVLVASGSALFFMLTDSGSIAGDATRIPAQIVSGIGFLGAGVIMKEGVSVKGLNTAATIWCASAVGCFAGTGLVIKAIAGALVVLGCNVVLRPLALRINRQPQEVEESESQYQVRAVCREEDEFQVRSLILQAVGAAPLVLRALHSEDVGGAAKVQVTAEIDSPKKYHNLLEGIVSRLSLEKGVSAVTWRVSPGESVG